MKIRLSPRQVRIIARPVISLLARTWRYELPPRNPLEDDVRSGRATVVIACWHEELLPLLWHGRGFGMGVVVSGSRDGEYAAQVAEGFGYRALRGSSSRRGAKVLLEAVRELQAGTSITFTPDGPRGPRRVFKPGAALAAQRAGVPLVPVRATRCRPGASVPGTTSPFPSRGPESSWPTAIPSRWDPDPMAFRRRPPWLNGH